MSIRIHFNDNGIDHTAFVKASLSTINSHNVDYFICVDDEENSYHIMRSEGMEKFIEISATGQITANQKMIIENYLKIHPLYPFKIEE